MKLINDVPRLSCTVQGGGFYPLVNCVHVMGQLTPEGSRIDNDGDIARHLLDGRQVARIYGAAYRALGYHRIAAPPYPGLRRTPRCAARPTRRRSSRPQSGSSVTVPHT
ncbi:hypothetical protein ACWCQW_52575 [Streptomyces mirabilis]